MRKLITLTFIILSFLISYRVSAEEFDVPSKSAYALEVSTGKILYEKNSQKALPVGPTSKLLTAYIIYREVEQGHLKWTDRVAISDYAYSYTSLDVSNVPLEKREYSVKELLTAMLVTSANGATVALAEHVAGSEAKFVDMMSHQLRDWKLKNFKIVNSTGLSNAYLSEDNLYLGTTLDDENRMTAKSLATIAYHLLNDYPEVTKITRKSEAKFDGEIISSYNMMLKNMPYFRGGVDGLATGTTELAGSSFVASSTTNGMKVITVILNADGWQEDSGARFMATNQLLNYVAGHYYPYTILKKNKGIEKSTVTILDGKDKSVDVITRKSFTIIKFIDDKSKPKIVFKPSSDKTYAPIKKGQQIGDFVFKDRHAVGEGYLFDLPSTAAVAKSKVEKSFFLKVWWNHFVTYVNDNL